MLATSQTPDLSADEWQILEFHRGKVSLSSTEIQTVLSFDRRKVLDCLHILHYEGLVYFIAQYLGIDEEIVSAITKRGLEALERNAM